MTLIITHSNFGNMRRGVKRKTKHSCVIKRHLHLAALCSKTGRSLAALHEHADFFFPDLNSLDVKATLKELTASEV